MCALTLTFRLPSLTGSGPSQPQQPQIKSDPGTIDDLGTTDELANLDPDTVLLDTESHPGMASTAFETNAIASATTSTTASNSSTSTGTDPANPCDLAIESSEALADDAIDGTVAAFAAVLASDDSTKKFLPLDPDLTGDLIGNDNQPFNQCSQSEHPAFRG